MQQSTSIKLARADDVWENIVSRGGLLAHRTALLLRRRPKNGGAHGSFPACLCARTRISDQNESGAVFRGIPATTQGGIIGGQPSSIGRKRELLLEVE